MCGLAGVVGTDPRLQDVPELVSTMCSALARRGPDDHGIHVEPLAALGHRRLSIVDRQGGAQPMRSPDGRVTLSYNGETYNHAQLRRDLEPRGHRFSTNCDTETVLAAYLEHGVDCPRHLRGMFAFAIWDAPKRQLLLVRDRLGIKPLFYAQLGGALLFGSEIKAILCAQPLPRTLDPQALDDYFAYGFVRAPKTIYRSIRALLPGHRLIATVDDSGLRVEQQPYWQLPVTSPPGVAAPDYQEAKEELQRLFEESVRLRLLADVPLGALLSGGIDSSAVVWAMARAQSRPVQTFSIGFREPTHDETPVARLVAQHFGTEHHEECVSPDGIRMLPEIVRDFDEPFADPSAIPSWYLCQMARRHVTVCLTGDGGDELFAGYRRYATIGREWPRRDGLRLRALARLRVLAAAEGRFGNRVERLGEQRFEAYYARFRNNYSVSMRRRLFTREVADAIDMEETQDLFQRVALVEGAGPEASAQLADLQGYLTDDILVKVDRMSMAHGLEARVPLLDHELLEFVQALPHSYKWHAGRSKRILVDMIRPHLPRGVLDHPKHGFSVPLGNWFRTELRERLRAAVFGSSFASGGLFRPEYVRRLYDLHQSRRLDLSFPLWQLLVFDEWWRSHGEPPGWGPA